MLKKLLFVIVIVMLGIASYATNKFIPVHGIRFVYFIPAILCIGFLFKSVKPRLGEIAVTTLGGILYIWGANLFNIENTVNDGIWCLVGGTITYLLILLYGYAKKEGAKEIKKEMKEESKTENEKNN